MSLSESASAYLQIRQLIENWVIWRDSGDWDRLATIWHDDGEIITTWSQSSARVFAERSRLAWQGGMQVLHTLGGSNIEIQGTRAIAQSKMTIMQRAPVHGILVDVTCHGRFWDAFEERDGRWGLLFRRSIYEMDHMSAVDPAANIALSPELLASFPEGYRHLAYLQTQLGLAVNKSLPGTRDPQTEALREKGRRWLAGEPRDCLND